MAIPVLVTRPIPLPPLSAKGEPLRFIPLNDGPVDGARALVSTAYDLVDEKVIVQLPNSVGLIANAGIGTDNVDLNAARARGISVSNTPAGSEDTADLAFALILAAARRVPAADRYSRSGKWLTGTPFDLGMRVHGARLGLVGFGAIAQGVARRAQGFDMQVRYWNHRRRSGTDVPGTTQVDTLEELVAQSDIVSLHVPLTPTTRGLVNTALLAQFKPGAVLVNTSRGPIIEDDALLDALASGQIGAAGLDVFDNEPAIVPGYTALEQVVLTPHIGSATREGRGDIGRRLIANLLSFLEDGRPIDSVI